MGRQASKQRRLAEEDAETVREDYVKKMRDNYPLIVRTLMHDIIVSIDKDANFVFLNDAAVEFLGKSSEKLIGANFTEYLHPEDVNKAMAILQELIGGKENQVEGFIIRVKSPQGFRTLAMNGIAVFDNEGNYIGAHATGRDLTDIMRTEKELEQSRSQFRRLFEVIVDPLVIVDMTGKILEVSQSAEEILGFPKEELVGKHFLETKVATADTAAVMIKNLERMKKGRYIPPYAIEAVTKDGKKLSYEVNHARIVYKGEPAILAIFRNLTEQKKAEEKLQESEERFNYFLENAPEAIWVQDLVGTFLDGNKRAEELTGYKNEEMIGKNMLEILVQPESIPRLMEAFKPNKNGEMSGPTELELIRKDGSLVPVEASTIPIGRDGKIEIIGIARDITERKKAEEALKESEQRFRELSELLPEIVFETDVNGRLTFVNQIAFERFGYTPKDFDKGVNALQMLIPEDRDRARDEIDRVMSGADVGFTEYTGLKKDGSTFPIMIHSTPIIHENMPVGLRGILVDITERKKMENILKDSEEKYRTIFEGATDGIAALDPKTMKVIFANPKMTEITGYPLDELLNATIIDFIPKNEISSMIQQFQNHVGGKRDLTRYIPVIRKDKTRIYCDVRSKFLNIGNQQYLTAFVRDVTEQKKAEEALKESEERFRSTLDSMLEGCQIVDYNWRYIYVNDAGARHSRSAKKDLLGKTIMETQPGIEKTELFSVLRRCMNERVPAHMEYEFLYPNGEKNWFELSIEPMPDGIFVLSIDINDRKKAEEALKESEKRSRELSDLLPEVVFETDATGRITFVNQIAFDQFGYSQEDYDEGLNAAQMLIPEDRDRAMEEIDRVLSGADIDFTEYTALRKNGSTFPIMIHSTPIIRGNMPVGLRGIIVDITERKKMEVELKASLQKFRTIFEGATDGIIAVDPETTKIVFANPQISAITGYSSDELLNLGIADIIRKEDVPTMMEQFTKQMDGKAALTRNIPVLRKDKTIIYCDGTSRLMQIGNNQYLMGFVRDVTEQRNAVEALRESEAKYRELINGMNDTALVLDFDTNIIDINQTAVDVLGYSRKELLSMKVKQVDASLTAEEIKDLAEKMKNSGLIVFETAHTTKGGRTFPVEISASKVTYHGKPAILSIARDITERKRAEKELIRLSSAVRMSNDSIVITDLDGAVVDVNDATLKMYGTDNKKELIGIPSFDLIVPEEREEVIADMKEVLEKGYVQNQEYTVTPKDGSKIPVEMSTAIMKDANGEPIGFVTISRDITERKKAEEALRSSEEAARRLLEFQNKIIDTATVWVNLIDLKGNVILWNRAAELVSGYSRKEIIGNNKMWKLLYPDPDYRAKIFSIGKEITKEGKSIEDFYSTIRCKDGSLKTISWYATNIADEKGEPAGSLSIGIDVTEREKARQAINNALSLLRQSNEELESYTYVVSHDLKAPLRTIRSFGSFILEDYEDKLDETGKDYLNRMITASSHLDSMIEDLLVLSRVGRKFTELEKVDLNELLKEILADLEATIKERNAKIIVDKLPTIHVHRVWKRQLFMNLISNALKFNESKTPKIEVLYEERENDHLFKVRDNGIGIEEKYLERIFNLFERAPTEKKYDGTGAGLAICKKIVEHLGGKIRVESTPGKGSTFIFTIPKELKQTKEK